MESTTLASADDAELILRLYELRRDPVMRKARLWMTAEFWPQSASDVLAILRDFGSEQNQQLRQVHTYWEMAAAFVLRGALDADLFVDCNIENLFLLAKLHPMLEGIRQVHPQFFVRTEQIVQKHTSARHNFERILETMDQRRADHIQQSQQTPDA